MNFLNGSYEEIHNISNVVGKYTKYIPIFPHMIKSGGETFGDMKEMYAGFYNFVLKILEALKLSAENKKRTIVDPNITDMCERMNNIDYTTKEENPELYMKTILNKDPSVKPMFLLVLILKEGDCDLNQSERHRNKSQSKDIFTYYIDTFIKEIEKNKSNVIDFMFSTFNDLNVSLKDATSLLKRKRNENKEDNEDEDGRKKKKKKAVKEDVKDAYENVGKRRSEKVITKSKLEDIMFPFFLLYNYEKFKKYEETEEKVKKDEILRCSIDVLDLNNYQHAFSIDNIYKMIADFGYDISYEDLEFGNGDVKLHKDKWQDLKLSETFTLQRFKNTKIPYDDDEFSKLVRRLISIQERDEEDLDVIKNDFDKYIEEYTKLGDMNKKDKKDKENDYAEIQLLLKKELSERYRFLIDGTYGNCKTRSEYANSYQPAITAFRKEAIEKVNLITKKKVPELKDWYSVGYLGLMEWADKNVMNSMGKYEFFKSVESIKDKVYINSPFYIPYYVLDLTLLDNYLLYFLVNLENVIYMGSNKELLTVIHHTSRNIFDSRYEMKANFLVLGKEQTGKSFMGEFEEKTSAPGTVIVMTGASSLRSEENNSNTNHQLRILNELPNNNYNEKSKNGDTTAQEIYKDISTSMRYIRKKKVKDADGNWIDKTFKKDTFWAQLIFSNNDIPAGPISSRFLKTQVTPIKDQNKVNQLIAASDIQKTIAPEYRTKFEKYQIHMQFLIAEYHKYCTAGATPQPTLVAIKYFVNYVVHDLRKKGVALGTGIRSSSGLYMAMTEFTILNAIIATFCVPGGEGFRKEYDPKLMIEVGKKAYATIEIAIIVLSLFYTIIFKNPMKENIEQVLTERIFPLKNAIRNYESKHMGLVKNKDGKKYKYVNSGEIKETYTEKTYQIDDKNNKILDEDKNSKKAYNQKVYTHNPFVDKSNYLKLSELNFSYDLFMVQDITNLSDETIGFEKLTIDKVPYLNLNYLCFTARSLYNFYSIFKNTDSSITEEDVKRYIEGLQQQYIKPKCVLKFVKEEDFLNSKITFETLFSNDDLKGKTRQEMDDELRKYKNLKSSGFFKYINQETEDTNARCYVKGGATYDPEVGIPCCRIQHEDVKVVEGNQTKIVKNVKICIALSLVRFDLDVELQKTISEFNYEGMTPKKTLFYLPKEGVSNYTKINIEPKVGKTIVIENTSHLTDTNKKVITNNVNKTDFEDVDIEEFLDGKNIWKEHDTTRFKYRKVNVENPDEYTFTYKFKKLLENKQIIFGKDELKMDINEINFLLHQEQFGTLHSEMKYTIGNKDKRTILKHSEEDVHVKYMNYMNSKEGDKIDEILRSKLKRMYNFDYPSAFKSTNDKKTFVVEDDVSNDKSNESEKEEEDINFNNFQKKTMEKTPLKKKLESLVAKKN